MTYNLYSPKVCKKFKKFFFVHSIKVVSLSLNESKLIAKIRGIKGYKSMSKDELLSAPNASESLKESERNFDDPKPKTNFFKVRIEKIRKEFNESRHKSSKSKTNEIKRNLYEIENEKNLFESKIKEIERNLTELEENLFKPKKYYDYDDTDYRGIRYEKDLFDLSIDEDYCKPIITNGAFNNNYIQYESKEDKDKILTPSEYLDMIKPYLSDIINYHKTQGKSRVHSSNTITERKTQSEWKIQLTMAINFISFEDSDETRIVCVKINNVEIIMGSETNEIIEELFKSLLQRYHEGINERKRIYF